jgi:uncharacterized protein
MNLARSEDWAPWESRFEERVRTELRGAENDPAHDLAHFRRVVTLARALGEQEGADLSIVLPAAWLHDLVNVPKNDPRRSEASRLSAQAACSFLREAGYPEAKLEPIAHAIEAHSFSAQIEPKTREAMIVQDADRLDGLGAIGLARMFAVSGLLKRALYSVEDPFAARGRELDDLRFTVDHFYRKLFLTVKTLRTEAGRREGERRAEVMREFLRELGREIGVPSSEIRLQ